MKNRLKNVFLVALIFFSNTIFAQLTEQSQADDLKIAENIFEELDVFLEQNKDYKLSNAEQMKFESMFLESEDNHHHEEINEEIVKSNFIKEILTEKFYNNNPKYREVFAKTLSFLNPCFNGGFETSPLTTYSAFYHFRTTLLQCDEVPPNVPGSLSYFPTGISIFTPYVQLVTNGFDPNIPALTRTHSGNKAVRVNKAAAGGSPATEISVLRKGFSPITTGEQYVSFYSAIVLSAHDPFFLARIVNDSGVVVGGPICITPTTPGVPWNTYGAFKWLNWECFSIPYFGNEGQNYFLEIAAGDCNGSAGPHIGYAYVDDICMNTCGVPTDLECIKTTAGQHLSWSAMPGAVSYEIVFNFNDPLCCPAGGGLPSSTIVNSITNSYNVPISFAPCFSWSVRAVYSDGTKSGFSERECSCNECPKPINLGCVPINNHRLLSWDSVFGSSGYEVMITYNDPYCDGCSGTVSTIVISTVSNWLEVIDVSTCFSWKVRSKCAGDLYSEWSDIECSCLPSSSSFIQNQPIMSVKEHSKSDSYITVSPNPADQIVTFELQNKSGDEVQNAELKIISLEGKIVYQSTISLNEKKNVDVSGILPGMYIFVVSTDSLLIDAGKLIIK